MGWDAWRQHWTSIFHNKQHFLDETRTDYLIQNHKSIRVLFEYCIFVCIKNQIWWYWVYEYEATCIVYSSTTNNHKYTCPYRKDKVVFGCHNLADNLVHKVVAELWQRLSQLCEKYLFEIVNRLWQPCWEDRIPCYKVVTRLTGIGSIQSSTCIHRIQWAMKLSCYTSSATRHLLHVICYTSSAAVLLHTLACNQKDLGLFRDPYHVPRWCCQGLSSPECSRYQTCYKVVVNWGCYMLVALVIIAMNFNYTQQH